MVEDALVASGRAVAAAPGARGAHGLAALRLTPDGDEDGTRAADDGELLAVRLAFARASAHAAKAEASFHGGASAGAVAGTAAVGERKRLMRLALESRKRGDEAGARRRVGQVRA